MPRIEKLTLEDALTHLLEECRMVLPGVQALFGFQLIVVFNRSFFLKLTFVEQWNSYFWPRAILTTDNPTLQVSVAFISYGYYTDYSMVFAATAVATLPLVVVFIVFGRQIISGIMEGAVKA